jgi:hypothetical protein
MHKKTAMVMMTTMMVTMQDEDGDWAEEKD